MTYLTGRTQFPYKAVFDGREKRATRVIKLYGQYDELIRGLKTEGALLNHIRPEFLLSFGEYNNYIKSLTPE